MPSMPLSRMSRRPIMALVVVAIAAAAVAGCASSKITELWRDPAYSGAPLHNVMVVSMSKDATRRRLWEDTFSAGLSKKGVKATPESPC